MDPVVTTMDWVQVPALRLLAALKGAASVSAAARHTGTAQSNASRTIALLERRTGLRIIERSTRGSMLTADGRLLASWAEDVLEALERFALGAQALAGSDSARVTVGASQTVAEYLAPLWISFLRRTHPQMTVKIHMHNSEQVIEGVTEGKFDLGFIESPSAPRHLHHAAVREDRLEVVVAPNHPWAGMAARGEEITLEHLAETPFIVREVGSGTRALIDEALNCHRRAHPVTELNSTAAIIRAAREGVGPAVLSGIAAEEEISSGCLFPVPVRDMPLVRTLRAVWTGPARLVGAPADLLEAVLRAERH